MIFSGNPAAMRPADAQMKFFCRADSVGYPTKSKSGREPLAMQHVWCFGAQGACVKLAPETKEAPDVDLALRLNVLAVCAVFLFIGAVLLGAF